jgi:pimeloyl-ACP methyl ester carboxylesterase
VPPEVTAPPQAGAAPAFLVALVERYDPALADVTSRHARIRLVVMGEGQWDAVVSPDAGTAALEPASGDPDAVLSATPAAWQAILEDVRGGMAAFERGELGVRRDLHLGVGFLAASAASPRLRFATVRTRSGHLSTLEAGEGPPAIALHGLGATKASFLPTVTAMGDDLRIIAVDLPGFGDSGKPLRAPYDARFFADSVVELLDALGLERAHLIGNSMGGRVALEIGLRHPDRVDRMALLAPSLAWKRGRQWARPLKLVRPELGAIQPAPRAVVERIVERVVPGASDGWVAAGVDEFLRSYLTPRGRAAFYAAARNIYLDEPYGPEGFWTRLPGLRPESLFVWGTRDTVVPLSFARHVSDALPHAYRLDLPCGHVPQLERPQETHDAVTRFLLRGDTDA